MEDTPKYSTRHIYVSVAAAPTWRRIEELAKQQKKPLSEMVAIALAKYLECVDNKEGDA